MNDVSLWQNEIQFPVKNIWDSLNIFYISDIHLEFHIEGFETIKKRSLPPAIRKLVIDIFGENKDRAKRGYFDYIIIDGDIADDIAIFFSRVLIKRFHLWKKCYMCWEITNCLLILQGKSAMNSI